MRFFNHLLSAPTTLLVLIVLVTSSCKKDDDKTNNQNEDTNKYKTYEITSSGNEQDSTQSALIRMDNRDTIEFQEGTFNYNKTLTVEGKTGIVIKGQGRNNTSLSFANQQTGAEGLRITNCDSVIVNDLTIEDTKGDALKAKDCNVIAFNNIGTIWTGTPSSDNGAYGLYPVKCDDVMIDSCYAKGASDAGIYVGQTDRAIIKNSVATKNVAGIEVENTIKADVFNNEAHDNTGGILIFDLPDLTQYGRQCRVFDNLVENNNRTNFAPGGVVSNVPAGTGIMVISTEEVEIFDNQILKNNVLGTVVINYEETIGSSDDPNFDPYPRKVEIHDNQYNRTSDMPTTSTQFGIILQSQFANDSVPDIQLGGNFDPNLGQSGGICIKNNQNASFVNLNIENQASFNFDYDITPHRCDHSALSAVSVATP